jgi:hypothetical protein
VVDVGISPIPHSWTLHCRKRGWNACRHLQRLATLLLERGAPEDPRSENDPEMASMLIRKWLEDVEVQTMFI